MLAADVQDAVFLVHLQRAKRKKQIKAIYGYVSHRFLLLSVTVVNYSLTFTQLLNAYNLCSRQNSAKLIGIIGQFLKGNNMGPIKMHNGGNYAYAQDSNAYNFC